MAKKKARRKLRQVNRDKQYNCHAEVPAPCPRCGSPVFRDFAPTDPSKPATKQAVAIATCLNQDCSFGVAQMNPEGLSEADKQFCIGLTIHFNGWLPQLAEMKKTGKFCHGCTNQKILCRSCG